MFYLCSFGMLFNWFWNVLGSYVTILSSCYFPLRLREVFMGQQTRPTLIQVLACYLYSAKPLSDPNRIHCHLGAQAQTSITFQSKYTNFHLRKWIWERRLRNVVYFVQASVQHHHRGYWRSTFSDSYFASMHFPHDMLLWRWLHIWKHWVAFTVYTCSKR